MLEAEMPRDEKERLASLRKLKLLDSPLERRFEKITQSLAALLNVPIASFTLIDEGRQWFKSTQGLDASESERKYSMCAHTILGDDIMIVNDACKDRRFFDNP
ncbi:MAG: hypothetical protein JWM96_653, partial [Alphaproteobacteria bacterium]|nr:hypothetical protein [Alphaproteobacteria bacterium]